MGSPWRTTVRPHSRSWGGEQDVDATICRLSGRLNNLVLVCEGNSTPEEPLSALSAGETRSVHYRLAFAAADGRPRRRDCPDLWDPAAPDSRRRGPRVPTTPPVGLLNGVQVDVKATGHCNLVYGALVAQTHPITDGA